MLEEITIHNIHILTRNNTQQIYTTKTNIKRRQIGIIRRKIDSEKDREQQLSDGYIMTTITTMMNWIGTKKLISERCDRDKR